jgi:hypothetical protein
MRLKFHPGKYPKTGNIYQRQDGANFIKRIVVDTPLGWFERINLPQGVEIKETDTA